MPGWTRRYVRLIEALNRRVGQVAMYLIFVMMGILLWSSISKTFLLPAHWTLLGAQFTLVAYFMLGGPWALQAGANVRMDLAYGSWSPRRRAWADAVTVLALLVYLGVLLWGGVSSTAYAIEYGETSRGLWRVPMWPIKLTMCIGVGLMILQGTAEFLKDIARIRGEDL